MGGWIPAAALAMGLFFSAGKDRPFPLQELPDSCGSAVASYALGLWVPGGVPESVLRESGSGWRWSLSDIGDALGEWGVPAQARRIGIADLRALLASGVPSILHYTRPVGHFVLAMPGLSGYVALADPAEGVSAASDEEITERWSGAVLVPGMSADGTFPAGRPVIREVVLRAVADAGDRVEALWKALPGRPPSPDVSAGIPRPGDPGKPDKVSGHMGPAPAPCSTNPDGAVGGSFGLQFGIRNGSYPGHNPFATTPPGAELDITATLDVSDRLELTMDVPLAAAAGTTAHAGGALGVHPTGTSPGGTPGGAKYALAAAPSIGLRLARSRPSGMRALEVKGYFPAILPAADGAGETAAGGWGFGADGTVALIRDPSALSVSMGIAAGLAPDLAGGAPLSVVADLALRSVAAQGPLFALTSRLDLRLALHAPVGASAGWNMNFTLGASTGLHADLGSWMFGAEAGISVGQRLDIGYGVWISVWRRISGRGGGQKLDST